MLLILSLCVLFTSFLSGIFGMAGGMILMGILLVMMSVEKAMVVHGLTQFASNGWRAVLWRRSIRWRVFGGYAIGAALILALSAVLHIVLRRPAVLVLLGVMPFLTYLLPPRLQLNVDRPGHPFACGLVSMAILLLSGGSGPLLDTFFVRSQMSRYEVVSTKAAVQTLSHAARIAFYGALLVHSDDPLGASMPALLVLCAIAGTSMSKIVLDRLTDSDFRNWTRRIVLVLGGCYLVSGLWAFSST